MRFTNGGAALVTGGSQRLGKAMAVALANRGMCVAVHFRNSKRAADETVGILRNLGVDAVSIQADLSCSEQTQGLISAASRQLRRKINLLINNASVFEPDDLCTASRKDWQRSIETNLSAPFFLIQEFAAQVPSVGRDMSGEVMARAAVVNMVDSCVDRPTSGFSTYTISKMGLWDLTRVAAQDLAPNIQVNAIGPGPTLIGSRQSEKHFAVQRKSTLLQRGANPEEVVSALNFLLDNPSITSQLIRLDGGAS